VKKFFKIFPFILMFLLIFGMQVQLDVSDRFQPFPEPYGREQLLGDMTPNRPAQALGDNRFAWLLEKELVIATIDPGTQAVNKETRPLPHEDIYASTNFRLVGDDIVWIGNQRTLKHATWQGSAWSQPQEIATGVHSMDVEVSGDHKVLFAGSGEQLKIWEITANGVQDIRSLPFKKVVFANVATDKQGVMHLGALDMHGSAIYRLVYLTFDPATKKVSEPVIQHELSTDTSQLIFESEFGIDNTHGYHVMTFTSTKTNSSDLRLVSFPLNNPQEGTYKRLTPPTDLGPAEYAYGAQLEPGQGDRLRIVYVAEWGKNVRVNGYEVFLSYLQNGRLSEEAARISNSLKMSVNPAFAKSGDYTTILYSLFDNFDRYTIYYTSDHPVFAGETNKLTLDDYTYSAMNVPQYMGVAVILMFYGLAWPVASIIYIAYFIRVREDSLYDHADRHLLVAIVLYLVSQIFIFLQYAKLENYHTYSPAWMHSDFAISMVFVAFAFICYLLTKLFGKLIYERNATVEFGYFVGLNLFSLLLFLSYFMAR